MSSTFEFGTTVKADALPDTMTIVTGITSILGPPDAGASQLVGIHTDFVYFGERLAHINWRAVVSNIDYPQARLVQETLKNFDLRTSLTEELPGNETAGLGMFTTAGAESLRDALLDTEDRLRDGRLSPVKLREWVDTFKEGLSEQGHGEVYDTDVREIIWDRLDRVLAELGIQLLEV